MRIEGEREAVADLNADGRLDVVATALSGPEELWLNDSLGDAHWLELKLEARPAIAMVSVPESW